MMTLSHTTRIAVQVIVDDDINNLAALVTALTLLFSILTYLGRLVSQVILLAGDFAEASRFVSTVFTIGFKSLAWGIGVRV